MRRQGVSSCHQRRWRLYLLVAVALCVLCIMITLQVIAQRATMPSDGAEPGSTTTTTSAAKNGRVASRLRGDPAVRVLEQLRPGYAERVTEALAAAQWHARSSQEAVDAAVASFVGVKEVQQWPVGGFEKRFRILGFSKCATTTLSNYIGNHPSSIAHHHPERWYEMELVTPAEPAPAPTLESHMRQRSYNWSKAVAENEGLIYGDGTPHIYQYTNSFWVPGVGYLGESKREAQVLSQPGQLYVRAGELLRGVDIAAGAAGRPVKYIVMVRDPVVRLYSAFRFYAEQKGHFGEMMEGYKPSARFFHQYVLRRVQRFQDCLFEASLGEAMTRCVIDDADIILYSITSSMYYPVLKQWLELTRTKLHEDVLLLRLEQLEDAGSATLAMAKVFRFLGLSQLSMQDMQQELGLYRQNTGKATIKESFGPMLPETEALLRALYAPFNAALAEFVGDTALLYDVVR